MKLRSAIEPLVRFGRFWLDAVSIIPFFYLIGVLVSRAVTNSVGTPAWVQYISLIRLVRMLRIVSVAKV